MAVNAMSGADVRKRSIASSALLVMLASGLSTVLGFAREIYIAHFFGTHAEVDVFLNASTIPTVLFGTFNGALIGALVPTFSEYMSRGRSDEVRRLGSSITIGLLVTLSLLAAAGWAIAPLFVPLIARGFPPSEQALEVDMVRWLMPGIVPTAISGVFAAIANAHHRFVASSLVWVALNVVTIACMVVFHHQLGIFSLVLGSVIGLFAQLVVQLPTMLRFQLIGWEFDWRHPGLLRMLHLLIPIAIGAGAAQVNIASDRYFASNLSAGTTAAIGYTTKLAYLPIQIIAVAIGTVIFPLVARQFAAADTAAVRVSMSRAVRMVSFIVIPCAAGLSVLAYPIVRTLFERGAFGPSATDLCATLVPFACLPLITTSFSTVLGRACLACRKTTLAVVGGMLSVVLNIALSAVLSPRMGAGGLLLSNGIAGAFASLFLLAILVREIKGLDWRNLGLSFGRTLLASFAMFGLLAALRPWLMFSHADLLARAGGLGILIAFGIATFLGVSHVLGSEEIHFVRAAIMRKLGRAPLAELEIADVRID